MSQRTIPAARLRSVVRGSYRAHEDLVRAGLQLLALLGVEATPIHTGPKVTPRPGGGFDLRANPAQHGTADIVGCIPPAGRYLAAEAKTGKARRSRAQVRTGERVSAKGGLYVVFRSVTDLQSQLTPHLPRRASA